MFGVRMLLKNVIKRIRGPVPGRPFYLEAATGAACPITKQSTQQLSRVL